MSALVHVLVPFLLCVAVANTGVFDQVLVDTSYEHYAERAVPHFPAFLAMPFNCLVNVGYVVVGAYWLRAPGLEHERALFYAKDVFALMALLYGPVQWARLATLRRAPAVLDQWFTLPIFAWVPVWCGAVARGWSAGRALAAEACSLLSYALALLHERGFELALAAHIAAAVHSAAVLQRARGDAVSLRYFALAALACAGFVALKLLDHPLAQWWPFQRLTGHFWSKVCDVLQFHYSLCFLTHISQRAQSAHKRTS
ncbi:transmembrane protein 187 [Salminus brasiliensis]|uniref:transmembrane protein 187 n=1 Tax=Salminus brasiliensis TaxID=930266 RepID=UPI003B83243B